MKKIINMAIGLGATTSLLTGCGYVGSYVGGTIEDCPEIEAPVSRVIPAGVKKSRIALLPVTDEFTETTDNSPARELQSQLQALAAARDIEMVDGFDVETYEERVKTVDLSRTAPGLPDESIRILKIEINGSSLTYNFNEAETVTENGETRVEPAYCVFTASVTGEARSYGGSPLELSISVPLSGAHEQRMEMDDSTCPMEPEAYNEIYRMAAADAAGAIERIVEARARFDERSYVQEVRMCYDKRFANFVWLSTGPDDISKKGTRVNIYRQYWFKDKLKNELTIRRTLVASGKITESAIEEEVWVKISDRNEARAVMLGDIATLDD